MQQPIRIELPIFFDGGGTVNSWLVRGATNTLIDCGLKTDHSWDALTSGLKKEGMNIEDIDQVVITHGHADHMGAAAKIAKTADATIWIPEFLEPWATDLSTQLKIREEIYNNAYYSHAEDLMKWESWADRLLNYWDEIPVEHLHVFNNDDIIPIGDTQWQSIYTPGHCINQVVFYQADHKQLFSADMILQMTPVPYFDEPKAVNIQGRPPVLQQLLDSYDRIKSIDIEYVYPGHMTEMGNPSQLIERQVKRIHDNMERCQQIIMDGASDLNGIIQALYPNRINDSTFFMVVAILDHITHAGKVIRRKINDRWQYLPNEETVHSTTLEKSQTI